jgi:hydrophobic/amphiphilic exporter-1 (mainly G- bacteria), HAE1 family
MWFTKISIKNPVLATMMMLAFVVLGVFSYQRLKVDQFPDINFPVVVVITEYPGASPESVEADVSKKLEEAINTISNISKLSSRSYEGQSVVIIEFDLTVDPAKAAQDVREKVAIIKPILRKEVKDSRVLRFDPSDRPVISLSLSSPQRSTRELTTLADQIVKKRLENVKGVGTVNIIGGVKRQVRVLLNPAQMDALGVGVDQVLNAIRAENQDLPAGSLKTTQREVSIQVQGRFAIAGDLGNVVVAKRGGAPIYLRQLGNVVDAQEEVESLALLDGKPTLALSVLKAQGQNTIEVVDAVKATALNVAKELPADVKLDVINDGAKAIRTGVDNVKRTLIEGALLTILIVFLFLNSWRSTVITGLTLPVALIGTFLFMNLFGFTINMITLMALSLCVGLLIDDAIVVRENIVRHSLMGKDSKTAALEGTQEIGLAVLATTLSIVAVFIPIGFMGGIIGRFFYQFGVTVAAAVLISMFVSFTLDPMLSSIWHDPHPDPNRAAPTWKSPLAWVLYHFDRFTQWLSAAYQRMLRWALAHRKTTMALAAAAFFASFPIAKLLGSEFVPQADFSESGLSFQTPVGSSVEFTRSKAQQVDAIIRDPNVFPEVLYTYTTVNTGNSGKNSAYVYIRLKDRKDRSRSQKELTQPLRDRLAQVGGILVTSVGSTDPVGGEKTLVYSIQGNDQKVLQQLTDEAVKRISKIQGLVDLDTSTKPSKPTLAVELKRAAAADAGVSTQQVANALRPLIGGESAGTWQAPDGENYDIDVRLALDNRNTRDDVARLNIVAGVNLDGTPKLVKLTQVANLIETTGASQINRKDMTREIRVDANVFGRSAGEVGADIKQALDTMNWPTGYKYDTGGSTKNMNESFGYAITALALAIIFIYMVLASQFNSFLQPFAIMSSLPLTLIGVVLALLFFRSSMSMFSIIGFVLLMGLVTKNAILLVDFANQMREHGHGGQPMGRHEALLEAAKVRLRPILMTTLAMVFGMVPLAFGIAEGSEQRAPMGQAVIGGTITSSILTLVVVPVVYTYLDDLAAWTKRVFGKKS